TYSGRSLNLSMDSQATAAYGQFAKRGARFPAAQILSRDCARTAMEEVIARDPAMTQGREVTAGEKSVGLKRSVGFYGLMFISLGSIIGSGWLLGALNAAKVAGPASILSWVLAACMLALLALTYAELGATYPVAGGSARFPYYSHGPIAGFTAGWASWLQAVFIAPIEVLAAITYVNSVGWVNMHFNMRSEERRVGEELEP